MKTAFPIDNPVTLPVIDNEAVFPVRRIYCVGKNYAAHAAEMGGAVSKDAPFFFLKHPQDIVLSGETIGYPLGTNNLHYELELVVLIDETLKSVFSSNTMVKSAKMLNSAKWRVLSKRYWFIYLPLIRFTLVMCYLWAHLLISVKSNAVIRCMALLLTLAKFR